MLKIRNVFTVGRSLQSLPSVRVCQNCAFGETFELAVVTPHPDVDRNHRGPQRSTYSDCSDPRTRRPLARIRSSLATGKPWSSVRQLSTPIQLGTGQRQLKGAPVTLLTASLSLVEMLGWWQMHLLSERNQIQLIRLRTSVRRAVKRHATRLRVQIGRVFTKPGHDPDEPYALVTAPVKPRLPHKSGAVAVDPYEY